jgi:hypothetical protein
MRLENVYGVKRDVVAVLFIHRIQGRNLPPERRSSVAAEHEHNWLLLAKLGQSNSASAIQRRKVKVRRGISNLQLPCSKMRPQRFKGNDEVKRDRKLRHESPEFFRRAAHFVSHDPIESKP